MDLSFLQVSGYDYENNVMKMFHSKSHQDIHSQLNDAFVLLKLREQLEQLKCEA